MEKEIKILLVGINTKYIHTNLAIYNLFACVTAGKDRVKLLEFTINQSLSDMLERIYQEKPDRIAFSCYIWNISIIEQLTEQIHQVLPKTQLWFGGPEVSYHAKEQLQRQEDWDGIFIGEGEETFAEWVSYQVESKGDLKEIAGLVYRDREKQEIISTGNRRAIDLNRIPFVYDHIEAWDHKIIYYESSRGCPYHCTYCLSSLQKELRFRDLSLVQQELLFFLQHKIKQVKFIDRTFNCNRAHAIAIWKFIQEHDNGITNFHFELSADLLGEEELLIFSKFRKGQVQFEIGIQSIQEKTRKEIQRMTNLERGMDRIRRVAALQTIHQHLDLIAGLPYETFQMFCESFDTVYQLHPQQLQLGFLKVLKGTQMEQKSAVYGLVSRKLPPYEVLFTNWISYEELLILKRVEQMIEIYYNSHQFFFSMRYLEVVSKKTPFMLYRSLGDFCKEKGVLEVGQTRTKWYDILFAYACTISAGEINVFQEILWYDFCLREPPKKRLSFAPKECLSKKVCQNIKKQVQTEMQYLYIEKFSIDVQETAQSGKTIERKHIVIFDYQKKDPIAHAAQIVPVSQEWVESI